MGRTTVYNNITNYEKISLINKENLDLLDEFVEYLQTTDKSDGTIKGYINDIHICFIWMLENAKNKSFIDFKKRDMIKYQNYLINTLKVSPSRIRRLRASISSLSNFIECVLDEDYPDFRNIINKIPAPIKSETREKTILSDEECKKLLDYLVENKEYQKACIFALAWASGSRKSELLRFKVSYFDEENIKFGSLYKTPEKMKTKGRGKNGKQISRYVLVSKFKPYLDLWLEERKRLGIDDEYLFVNTIKGIHKPMTTANLDYMTKGFSEFLGVDFYFHCMRHNFTTGLVQSGVPASVIKDLVGWSEIGMVEIYTDIDADDGIGEYFKDGEIIQKETKSITDL